MGDRLRHPPDNRLRLVRKCFAAAKPHPLPDEDRPTTLTANQNTLKPVEGTESCKVCDRLAIGTHYGAVVCGCCASFFRRTIGNGKSYQCTCRLPFRNNKKGCRHCRFKNCLKAGMDAKVVQAVKAFPPPTDTLLSWLLSCHNRVYVSRGLIFREMEAQRLENSRWSVPDLGRGRSFEYLFRVEQRALTQYWTDFLRCFPHFKDGASPALLAEHFLAIWIKLEQVLATVSHGRIDKETCLCDYETTVPVTYNWFYAFICSCATKWTSDPAATAALTLDNMSEALHISWIVRRASLDNLEVTAVIQFLIAYYEKEMFADDASLKKFVNQVLRELHDHYRSTYHNYHERLGVIVSIVEEFHCVIRLNEQFYTQMSLYTKSGQEMQLPSLKETANSVYDLRSSVKM